MSQFMLVYKGESTDMSEMTQEEAMTVMGKWAVWMENVGTALTDVGAPFGQGVSVVDDGTSGTAAALTGYSIVEAGDLAGARALSADHPFLSEGAGDFAIDIFELMPAPFEE